MILANKNGTIEIADLVEENEQYYILKKPHCKTNSKVLKNDPTKRLFDGTDEAIKWIEKK